MVFIFRKSIVMTILSAITSTLSSASILDLLEISPSLESQDYVETKKQFQLHNLLTEQRHPKTWDLSFVIEKDTKAGLRALFSVDEDISVKCRDSYDVKTLEQAVFSVENAILKGRKIYLYGCGATGRLAKQVESSFWRPFWKKLQTQPCWELLKEHLPQIENQLIGEMTGGDRALISSLEGFEDLQIIGQLQLEDHGIEKGDVVFAITEGGETSSVIGTILTAFKQYEKETELSAKNHLYFMYNNPDEVLLPLDRSRSVLENPDITKIRLFTGPQSITGSTRMQATTSETFVMGLILEQAIFRILKRHLDEKTLVSLGFKDLSMKERLLSFIPLQEAVSNTVDFLSPLTDLETETYRLNHVSTYLAVKAQVAVFTDATERAPTFRLFPLDPCNSLDRKSWIQSWGIALNQEQAWLSFLGRPFKGLSKEKYQIPFSSEITDPYLKKAALSSLERAGDEQQWLYDFSFSESNLEKRGPQEGDLGVIILLEEELEDLLNFTKWFSYFSENKASLGIIVVTCNSTHFQKIKVLASQALVVPLVLPFQEDPLGVRAQIALKMLLNAHSTAVMAKLGRVVGNTMTNVNPGNLKLIGRATFLIQSHINHFLPEEERISYVETNSLLFDAIRYVEEQGKKGVYSEVALSIIRYLESYKTGKNLSWKETERILVDLGLNDYLRSLK